MEYSFLVSPLVVVAGLGDPGKSQDSVFDQSKTPIPLHDLRLKDHAVQRSDVVEQVSKQLRELSMPPTPWNARLSKMDRINIVFSETARVPRRSVKPSPISPRHPSCGSSIFTVEWIKKYSYYQPVAAVVFFDSPHGEEKEDELIESLTALKAQLAENQIQLIIGIIGEKDILTHQVPFLRKQVGLPSSCAFSLATNADQKEAQGFVQSLQQELLLQSQDFFANKMRALRAKRKAVAPPLDLFLWDTRYTLKLAYCSEFKGDLAGAIKLYESAYDALAVLFENKAISITSSCYDNAREVLDAVAVKIFQHSLPSRMAFDKLSIHLSTIERMWEINGVDKNAPHALIWRGTQHAVFAQLCVSVRQAGLASAGLSQHPAGNPTGLIWLDAAVLFATEPNTEAKDDPFVLPSDNETDSKQHDPQVAFLNAISELSGYKRARAFALSQYGAWLSRTDTEAASQAFKSAQQMLSPFIWPEVQKYLSTQLNDRFMLFTLGEADEMPALSADSKNISALFNCTGTFERAETHIGRKICAQVTLEPRFPGKLKLNSLRITHSLGSVTFKSVDDPKNSNNLVVFANDDEDSKDDSEAYLVFDKGQPRTFQFGLFPIETGDVELLEVEAAIGDQFSQTYPINEGAGSWLTSPEKVSPQTVKHLPITENSRVVSVTTRPAKLDVNDLTPLIAAFGETLRFHFELRSHEEHDIEPKISVLLSTKDESEDKLLDIAENQANVIEAGGSYVSVLGDFKVPPNAFELTLRVSFETSTDTLPVQFEYRKDVNVVKPFRVGFDLTPEYLDQEWPAMFAPTLELPQLARKWRLNCTVLSLFASEDIVFHSSNIRVDSEVAEIELETPSIEVKQNMHHNSVKQLFHTFLSRSKDSSYANAPRKFEAAAHVDIVWSRRSSGVQNVFSLPPVRLNLPAQEPRVLAVADKVGGSLDISQVTFHIENASSRLLNFSVSMSSSTFFAFQGAKAITIRMLPFSTRALTYQLTPLGDGAVQNKRPLPDLRVYDVNYKRTLAVLPGDRIIKYEQGSLFL